MTSRVPALAERTAESPVRTRRRVQTSGALRVGVLAIVAAWAVWQAFWRLGAANVTADEKLYAQAGVAYLHGDFSLNREHPPFGKYLFGLAQLVAGDGVFQARIVVALALLAGGAIIFVWLRREIGWWGALLGAGTWWVAPHYGFGTRIERFAILDPLMTFFMIAALAAAWWWIRSDRWWWAAASGAVMAMSVTTKVSTVVVLPAFLVLPILFRRWRALLVGGAIWAGTFTAVFVGLYLPMGIRSAITYMLKFQEGQQTNGHPVQIAGMTYAHSPWWGNLWFLEQGATLPVLVVLAIGVLAAALVYPGRLVAFLGLALACLSVFYLGVAKIALSTYYFPFLPLLVLLSAIGYAQLARRWRWTVAVGVAGALVTAFMAVGVSSQVAQEQPRGIALIERRLDAWGVNPTHVLFQAYPPFGYGPYFPDGTMDTRKGPFTAIVVGSDQRFPVQSKVTAFLKQERGELDHATVDGFEVWAPRDGVIEDTPQGMQIHHTP
ncbi:ArnT family glycosyltransferase [Curtobacterium sp. L1-20]|uniref:ArnT family glycosyltransferase n=1 Tax=Curtobacterium sp. L1-20 TaxID=3138181 RepID=UPI003B528601